MTRSRKQILNAKRTFIATCIALAGLAPAAAQAQAADDKWHFEATLYGWFPGIRGDTSFSVPGSGSPTIDLSSSDVIDALKMAFMGNFAARKGEWGVFTDFVYSDLGGDKSGTRDFTVGHRALPAGVSGNLDLDVKTYIWTIAGTYNLASKPEWSADLLFGARMLQMDQTLDWGFNGNIAGLPVGSRSGSTTVDSTEWDAIIGVRGRVNFGSDRKWFVPYYLDMGTGQSQFTWQAVLGLGYDFGWGTVGAAWRYLDYNFKSSSAVSSMSMSGPAVGVSFRF
jgi:hypothetical protein